METVRVTPNNIKKAAELLANNEIVAFPTETVYGLGIVYDSGVAFEKLVKAKKRPPNKPFALMCASTNDVLEVAEVDDDIKRIIKEFLPGPLTLLLKPKKNLPEYVTLGLDTIGIRIPNHELALDLIKLTGKPLLVPSANLDGCRPATNSDEVLEVFDNVIAGVIIGESLGELPSTIVDFTCKPIKLVREGIIPFNKILKFWEERK